MSISNAIRGTAKQYKASIANGLFLAVTAGLHNRIPGDTTYGGWATAEWNWFKGSGLIQGNLVQDGLNVPNCTFSTANYSYNQGVILQGLVEQSRATGDTSLLTTATSIATAAVAHFNHNGVLYDGCEPNCSGDGSAFKGIFARYLRALATATGSTQYDSFLTTTANSIVATDTNSSGQQGNSFVGPFALWTPTTQASAAEALVAALGSSSSTPPGSSGVLRGQQSSRCVDVPNTSQTNGTQVELWDCNGGSNQSWTSDSSGHLTVYGNNVSTSARQEPPTAPRCRSTTATAPPRSSGPSTRTAPSSTPTPASASTPPVRAAPTAPSWRSGPATGAPTRSGAGREAALSLPARRCARRTPSGEH